MTHYRFIIFFFLKKVRKKPPKKPKQNLQYLDKSKSCSLPKGLKSVLYAQLANANSQECKVMMRWNICLYMEFCSLQWTSLTHLNQKSNVPVTKAKTRDHQAPAVKLWQSPSIEETYFSILKGCPYINQRKGSRLPETLTLKLRVQELMQPQEAIKASIRKRWYFSFEIMVSGPIHSLRSKTS